MLLVATGFAWTGTLQKKEKEKNPSNSAVKAEFFQSPRTPSNKYHKEKCSSCCFIPVLFWWQLFLYVQRDFSFKLYHEKRAKRGWLLHLEGNNAASLCCWVCYELWQLLPASPNVEKKLIIYQTAWTTSNKKTFKYWQYLSWGCFFKLNSLLKTLIIIKYYINVAVSQWCLYLCLENCFQAGF